MKYLAVILVLSGVVMAQNPSVSTAPARNAAAGASATAGSAKAGASASAPSSMSAEDGSVSITEKPITKKKHAEVPTSLLGGSADPRIAAKMAENESVAPDQTEGVATAARSKPKPAMVKVIPKGQLHFEEIEPGSDLLAETLVLFRDIHSTNLAHLTNLANPPQRRVTARVLGAILSSDYLAF